MKDTSMDWTEIRERLAATKGESYWRSLEELAQTDGFKEMLRREFPQGAEEMTDPVSRRQFLTLAAASLALAGLSACTRQPTEKIIPYVQPSEEIIPGEPLYFATATSLQGIGTGILVESHTGRPTKIEGNAKHPASLGSTDAMIQASVLDLYDPDRSQVVKNAGEISTWDKFLSELRVELDAQKDREGAGIRVLTRAVSSPTLVAQLSEFLEKYPRAKWHQYEPISRDNVREGTTLAFGEEFEPRYRFDQADVIVSLDADFLYHGPGHVRYTREFASRRKLTDGADEMNRLYVVEPTPSITGSMADHRLPLRSSQIDGFARSLAQELGLNVPEAERAAPAKWIEAVAQDLLAHRGSSLVVAGDHQPPAVHALAHAVNDLLDNFGRTVVFTEPVTSRPDSLSDLVDDMKAGRVGLLIILEGNPVYDAPVDFDFAQNMSNVKLRVHLGLHDDETAELCHWHIPQAHELESWGDIRGFDGTVSLIQPLIEPLYDGKTSHEMLAALLDQVGPSGYDILRDHWSRENPDGGFDNLWESALHDGVIAGTAFEPKRVTLRANLASLLPPAMNGDGTEVLFRPDPNIFDGRFANNGWLQELPKPMTRITWDNAALISPAVAERTGLANGDIIEIQSRGRSVDAPVWIMPGQAEDEVTLHLGYGRARSGKVAMGTGFNAYTLRTSESLWSDSGIELRKTGTRIPLASTQNHNSMEGRHHIREASLAEYREHPDFAHELGHEPDEDMTLYPKQESEGYAWGMTIDLNQCIGCNACMIGCQSENNIPVIGKNEVMRGREMHWIRVDRYYQGDLDNPETSHQPVPCMQCENAPCEPVCPVGATVHGPEGLNEMVYNRCVGTRYCSNNCPYKVRRYNFLQYSDFDTPVTKLLTNPDVTVRTRGIMEKCTYCVQRINLARIQAKNDDRAIRDSEIVTACQAACPAEAITFGDINDPESLVSRRKAEPRNYGILTELNTRPRTTYLAKVRNPNPALEES
jgi:molybdopterin-containing oxidoreductase family iron-sulfur binding subunit